MNTYVVNSRCGGGFYYEVIGPEGQVLLTSGVFHERDDAARNGEKFAAEPDLDAYLERK